MQLMCHLVRMLLAAANGWLSVDPLPPHFCTTGIAAVGIGLAKLLVSPRPARVHDPAEMVLGVIQRLPSALPCCIRCGQPSLLWVASRE